ncbi:MAG: hypothetical protein ACP5NK_07840 [Thermoplasmata archaeon]
MGRWRREALQINISLDVSSTSGFHRELPASKAAGGISIGLDYTQTEGTLSFMLYADPSDFTDAGKHEAICNPIFLIPVRQ